jgi:hypothetical protein
MAKLEDYMGYVKAKHVTEAYRVIKGHKAWVAVISIAIAVFGLYPTWYRAPSKQFRAQTVVNIYVPPSIDFSHEWTGHCLPRTMKQSFFLEKIISIMASTEHSENKPATPESVLRLTKDLTITPVGACNLFRLQLKGTSPTDAHNTLTQFVNALPRAIKETALSPGEGLLMDIPKEEFEAFRASFRQYLDELRDKINKPGRAISSDDQIALSQGLMYTKIMLGALNANTILKIRVREVEPVTVEVLGTSMMLKLIRSFLIIVMALIIAVVVILGIHRSWTSIATESDADG